MKQPNIVAGSQSATVVEDEKKSINRELWQTCAGPLVNLPVAGTYVVYFPQGHSEQVAASMKKDVDAQIPNYSNLPPKLLCLLHNVSLHADPETDEVYAQMTLQPVHSFDKDALLRSDISMRANKPQTEFFCKTLTASDTSTHGGFSVPRRAAEKIFPPLDFTMQPPAQELMARDLHDNAWTFRHIYRGQPKRHLLTSGWSLFVNGKRLLAGDSVLFIRDEKQQLLLGIRRANRQPANLSSSVLSSDSMHIGILAAAAHAAANNSPFTVFFNPRTSPSEFVIPLAKYYKTACSNQLSLGMRFRMMFETEESGTRRYMGTITGISDLDPLRWKNSQWRNLQVGWDESTAGEKRNRVSIWEIEPVTAPFFMCPTPPFFCSTKRPWQPGMPDDDSSDLDNLFRRTLPWLGDSFGLKEPHAPSGFNSIPWMNMQNPSLANSPQPNCTLSNSFLQNLAATDISRQLTQSFQQNNLQFNAQGPTQSVQQIDQLQKLSSTTFNTLGSVIQSQQPSQVLFQNLQSHNPVEAQNVLQQQQSVLSHQFPKNLSQPSMPHQQIPTHHQQQNQMPSHYSDQQLHISDNQTQLQLLQKLQQQHQSLLAQHTTIKQHSELRQIQNQPNHLLDVPPNFSRSMTPQSHGNTEPPVENKSETSPRFAQQPKLQPPQQTGIPSELPGQMVNNNMNRITNQLSVCGDRSAVSDDVPSCSTSPSTNNGPIAVQSSARVLNSSGLETFSCNDNLVKDLLPESQGFFASQPYFNPIGTQIDYLDSSSSATSVLSQNDAHVPQTYNPMSLMFSDASQNREVVGDPRNNIDSQFGMHMIPEPLITKNMVGSSKDFTTNLSSGGDMLPGYENIMEAEHELSSPMVSHSFGVLDMAFHSIDSTINDDSFMNRGTWGPTQIPRLRTYTKVYKRGAVGRSIDITRYSGYDELKQDLARRFGIEGQLEDRHIIGWKLVYVDHENDVLLVGDDPWGEFLSCVKCIKILSPQEVRQMSLDGDIGNSCSLPNQACSTSDNEFMQKMIP